MISVENFTDLKRLLITLSWSIRFAIWFDELFWTIGACVLVIVITSRFFVLSLQKLDGDTEYDNETTDQNLFFMHLNTLMQILHYVRRYNPIMRSFIGFSLSFLCFVIIFLTFSTCFSSIGIPTFLFYLLCAFTPILIAVFLLVLYHIANFSHQYNQRVKSLKKLIIRISSKYLIKNKLNYVLDEMDRENTFDWFKYFICINFSFIIKVSYIFKCTSSRKTVSKLIIFTQIFLEMIIHLLLAVENYIITAN